MAEEQLRKIQFTYNANANLVLQTASSGKRDSNLPTGEPESLAMHSSGDMKSVMGSRAFREQAAKPSAKVLQKRDERRQEAKKFKQLSRIRANDDVLTAEVFAYYQPKTEATKKVFGLLLQRMEKILGGQPRDVVRNSLNEVLLILKDQNAVAKDQMQEINDLFPGHCRVDDLEFNKVLGLSKKITDFEDYTKPVDLDDHTKFTGDIINDEEEDRNLLMEQLIQDSSSDESEDEIDPALPAEFRAREEERRRLGELQLGMEPNDDEDQYLEETAEFSINPKDVDAYWLLRGMGEHFEDERIKKVKTDTVFEILERDSQTCENELVECLGAKKFDFAQFLYKNKEVIVWCTRLQRVKNDEAKTEELRNQMLAVPKLARILQSLERTFGTLEERQRKLARDHRRNVQNLVSEKDQSHAEKAMNTDLSEPAKWFNEKRKDKIALDELAFRQGGHFISGDSEWKLRKGSEYRNKKGYQETYVPAIQKRRSKDMIPQKPISELPEWTHKAFTTVADDQDTENRDNITHLNEVQSRCFDCAFNHAENMLVCAPTGAGKTNVALLCMLRELGVTRVEGRIKLDEFKIVYIAPMKSLVREIVYKFNKRLNPFGVNVAELSGDVQLTRDKLMDTQVIVSTPEKWDIVTRKGMHRSYTSLVKLVIIDEIHMLHDDRGPVLEAIVARTIRHVESSGEFIRLVGLSATLPNYRDVAQFLRVDPEVGLFYFDGSYRPCPLVQRFAGITHLKHLKAFQLSNQLCYEYCKEQFTRKQQVIVFVHSRKETVNTARTIIEFCKDDDSLEELLPPASGSWDILREEAEDCKNEFLRELLPHGIGIHHAGMSREDRSLVEDLFREEHIKILVSTATLAYGVNLPAHAVIVKGTQIYSPQKGRWIEISMQDIMQMFGRAGRPGYDTTGEAYLITSHKEIRFYLPLLNEQLPIESQLVGKMADFLNAEIVLGKVTNLKEATTWLAYSYLFVRMLANPETYSISQSELEHDPRLEQRRIDLAHSAAILLDKSNLIKYDRKSGSFQITDMGRVCAHYYLTHTTIQRFNEHLQPTMSDIEIFRVFSLADEFVHMGVREEEQQELSILKDKVPIPVKEDIGEASAKVNVLLQSYIARLRLEGYALMADMVYVTQSAGRLMRALFEIVLKRGWAPLACRTLNLCKMIRHRMWSIESPLRQFKARIPNRIVRKIEKSTFSWDKFFDLQPDQIGELINFPKQGKNIYKLVHRVPRLELKGHVQTITRHIIKVELTIEADFRFDGKIHGNRQDFWILVEDVDGENILHHEFFSLYKKFAEEENRLSFTIPIYSPRPPQYFVRVISDSWLGSESVMPISFRSLLLPEAFPLPTELLDLRPMSIQCLQDNAPDAMHMYLESGIDELNSIQTQVFSAFFKSDDNIFLGAPSGSGKTLCAELAMIKMLEEYPKGRCVYIAPYDSLARERYDDWRKRFGIGLRYPVRLLSGDNATDKIYLNSARIIVSTPVNWDKVCRRKTKGIFINLFIADDLHLISSEGGATYEMVVSRMRYMEKEMQKEIRFIGLATAVANYFDLADWIGASMRCRFNFPLSNRPKPLEVKYFPSDINSYEDRQIDFLRPCYAHINRSSPNAPVIIFAPNRKYTRTIASDLMALASAEEDAHKFLHLDQDELEPHIADIKSRSLQECLRHGIGYIHEFTSPRDLTRIKLIFEAGATQILVVERSLAWGLGLKSSMVAIMGTSYYDGASHTYEDYQLAELIKMMGYAQQPSSQKVCTAVIFTQRTKEERWKQFLREPFPVESHLDYDLADHLNAEVVRKSIESCSDAINYLTYTFYFTRVQKNPNYYSLKSLTSNHVNAHFSELIEETVEQLDKAGCLAKDDDYDLEALNPGLIANFYYISIDTVHLFSELLTARSKLKNLIQILCTAVEFRDFPVRQNEDHIISKMARTCKIAVPNPNYLECATKAHVLLQSHFSRRPVSLELGADRNKMVTECIPLLWSMIDLLSTESWLKPTLICLELCQMITQALWDTDTPLLQLPHVTRNNIDSFKKYEVRNVFDLVEMDDDDRENLLNIFTPQQKADIAKVCNVYPNIEINFEVVTEDVVAGKEMVIRVTVEREDIDDEDLTDEEKAEKKISIPVVNAPKYKAPKIETWCLIVGDGAKKNPKLLVVRRFSMSKLLMTFELRFSAPESEGHYKHNLFFMSDSYLGTDQEFSFEFDVQPRGEDDSSDDDDDDDSA